ncbi:MAG: hypothetical protein ACKO14_04045 [Armatimonadota bacterium]
MVTVVLFALFAGSLSASQTGGEPSKERIWYVSPKVGDTGDGSKAKPFRSIQQGLDAARMHPGHDTVILLSGMYTLASPPRLNGSDSNLTLRGEPGKKSVISGGKVIDRWRTVENGWWAAKVGVPLQQLYVHAAGQPDANARRYRPRLPKLGTNMEIELVTQALSSSFRMEPSATQTVKCKGFRAALRSRMSGFQAAGSCQPLMTASGNRPRFVQRSV